MHRLLLTLSFIVTYAAFGQGFYPPVVNYSTKEYGKNRNPEIYCTVQDNRGVMYFGTANGVLEFDGEKWNFFKVSPGTFVRSLAIDSAGVIYCGAYGDFGYLAPDSTGLLSFQSLLPMLAEDDRFFGNVWSIHATSSDVYFQSEEALFAYNSSSDSIAVIYPETSFHTSFLVDSTIYVRQREVGIQSYANRNLTKLNGTSIFEEYGVFGLHRLADDSLLIITQELGLYKWHNGGIRQLKNTLEAGLDRLGIFGSIQLSNGDIALRTLSAGAVVIDTKGDILKVVNRGVGIRSNVVYSIYQDRDLNLWLALENGISKVNYHSPLSYFDEKTGLEGNVQRVFRFNGQIYVGTSYGLFVYDKDGFATKRFSVVQDVTWQVWDLVEIDNNLIVLTADGILKSANGVDFERVNYEKLNTLVYRKSKDDIFAGGPSGIFQYDKSFNEKWAYRDNFSTFLDAEIDPENDEIIWLGTISTGAIRLKENEAGSDFEVDMYGDVDGLLDNVGTPILYGDSLIFGAKNGLFTFINETVMKQNLKDQLTAEELEDPFYTKGIFEPYALGDSIFDDQLLLLAGGDQRTWYCNEFKIGFFDHATKQFNNRPFWGIDYGRINTFYLEDNGVLWIGAAEGVIRYEENDFKKYETTFYSLIRKVSLTREDILFNGKFTSENDENNAGLRIQQTVPEIDYKQNDIQFLFSAPYFEDEHKPEYRFILIGNDENYSDWNLKSEAEYNNLHEGDYTFKVEARNIYGQISEEATYAFTVLPPWYRTSWAYVLYFIAFVLILFLGVQLSLKRLRAQNIRLEGIVEERTKEIVQKNHVLEHQKQEIEDSINYAQRIQEAILPLATEMRKWIPESFVLFRPKDIVSGDFYWFLERDNKMVFICADCTGHGVPGAFMSMIGSDRLNNIISENKTTSPGQILSELNRAIKKSLKQDGQKNATRDGMDAAICTIDLDENCIYYAGANRPLWIIDDNEFKEIKATKVAVRFHTRRPSV